MSGLTPSYRELAYDKKRLLSERVPYCNSLHCAGNTHSSWGVVKNGLNRDDEFCPDCKSALMFRTVYIKKNGRRIVKQGLTNY